ncbi:MAG: PQQ-binding-like beta-propeller repeat protein [Pirellulaceae bacterium]
MIGSCGSGGGNNELVAVRGGENPEEVFRLRANAGYVPTLIVVGDLLFVFYDRGVASCVDFKTGDTLWKERLSGGFSGSPVCAQDRIFVPDDNGKVICIAATAEFKLLGETDLEEECRSTPAIAGDLLLIRTVGHLIAVKAE